MKRTPNLNLPIYEGGDKFYSAELSKAMEIIDKGISDLQETINNSSGSSIPLINEIVEARGGEISLGVKITKVNDNANKVIEDMSNVKNKITTAEDNIKIVKDEIVNAIGSEQSLKAKIDGIKNISDKNQIDLTQRGINVKNFGAKGDGITNDTASIQSAIDSLASTGGEIYFPFGIYLVTNLVIPSGGIYLVGAGQHISQKGSIIYSRSAGTEPVIRFGVLDNRVYGGGMRSIGVFGMKFYHMGEQIEQPVDRPGVSIHQMSFCDLKDVTIWGFGKYGLVYDGAYDCVADNVEVCWCGYNSDYAVKIIKTSQYVDNSNALKFINCKFEFSPRLLYMDICRNILFTNTKFEARFVQGNTLPTIQLTFEPVEVSMINCMYGNGVESDFMIESSSKTLTISGSQFSMGVPNGVSQGAKWINCTNGKITFTNNNVVCASNSSTSFIFGSASVVSGNKFVTWSPNTSVFKLFFSVLFKNNELNEMGQANIPYIEFVGDNSIVDGNIKNGNISLLTNIASRRDNIVKDHNYEAPIILNTATPNVQGRSFIKLTNETDLTISDFLNGYNGQIITIYSTVQPSKVTIEDNSKIVTGSGASVALQPSIPQQYIFNEGIWVRL